MKSIIIGMGIGQLYHQILTNMGSDVVTVDPDPDKNADFLQLSDNFLNTSVVMGGNQPFDTAHICTPNDTHYDLARQIAPYAKIVFIEKPGVMTQRVWLDLLNEFPETRFMMVKNNMWRDNIEYLKDLADQAHTIRLNWINKDRIPHPGSWFTTKARSWGGVSRDLMPHLLSIMRALTGEKLTLYRHFKAQRWRLKHLTNTDYGRVNRKGKYDVDDLCEMYFNSPGKVWELRADWKSDTEDKRNIEFVMADNTVITEELGLCPESAYQNMIQDALDHLYDVTFWDQQLKYDYWIHKRVYFS